MCATELIVIAAGIILSHGSSFNAGAPSKSRGHFCALEILFSTVLKASIAPRYSGRAFSDNAWCSRYSKWCLFLMFKGEMKCQSEPYC